MWQVCLKYEQNLTFGEGHGPVALGGGVEVAVGPGGLAEQVAVVPLLVHEAPVTLLAVVAAHVAAVQNLKLVWYGYESCFNF